MNKNLLIAGAVVLGLLLCFPLLASLKGPGPGGAPTAPEESAVATPLIAAPASPSQPPLWNADNLVGTAWNMSGYTVSLGAGGVASANTPLGQVQGTWTVSGSAITVSAMGKVATGEISGDQILFNGQPATRAQ